MEARRVPGFLRLQLQTVRGQHVGAEIEPRSSERTSSTVSRWAISLAPDDQSLQPGTLLSSLPKHATPTTVVCVKHTFDSVRGSDEGGLLLFLLPMLLFSSSSSFRVAVAVVLHAQHSQPSGFHFLRVCRRVCRSLTVCRRE